MRLTGLDGGVWDVANAATAYTSAGFDLTSQVAGAAGNENITTKGTCVGVVTGNRALALARSGTNAFFIDATNNPPISGLLVTQMRVGINGFTCYYAFVQTDGKLVFHQRPVSDNFSTGNLQTVVPSGVSFVDVLPDGFAVGSSNVFWFATIESGQLYLYFSTGVAGTRIAGPSGASLNVNPTCTASMPHLSRLEQAVYVTWQEQCAGQPYAVYMRGLY